MMKIRIEAFGRIALIRGIEMNLRTYSDDPAWLDRYGMEAEQHIRPDWYTKDFGANFVDILTKTNERYEPDFAWIVK